MANPKLIDAVNSLEAQYLDVLEELCNIESPTADKERVDRAVNYLVDLAHKKAVPSGVGLWG